MLHTRKQQTEATMRAMSARNAYRAEIVKRAMGEHYVGHPVNRIQRLTTHEWAAVAAIDVQAAVAKVRFDMALTI
jgi:hypothetical protein